MLACFSIDLILTTPLSAAATQQRTTLESDARNTRHFRGDAASHCCTTLLTQHTTALHVQHGAQVRPRGGLQGAVRPVGDIQGDNRAQLRINMSTFSEPERDMESAAVANQAYLATVILHGLSIAHHTKPMCSNAIMLGQFVTGSEPRRSPITAGTVAPRRSAVRRVTTTGGRALQGDAFVIPLLRVGQARVPHPQVDADAQRARHVLEPRDEWLRHRLQPLRWRTQP